MKQEEMVRERGATEIAVADLTDRAGLDTALAVFCIAPAFLSDEAEVGKGMVQAAKQAGVRRFVFSPVIDPVIGALVSHSAKAPVEEAIIESGLECALLLCAEGTLNCCDMAALMGEVLGREAKV